MPKEEKEASKKEIKEGIRGRVVVVMPEGMHYETRGGNRRLDRVIPIFLS